jgi:DNA-binding beta-propeller fold protein YncE/outer membrane lipoprotein-sorting protein
MNQRDSVAVLLKTLDRPVEPRREFADALRRRLLAELPETNGHRAWMPRLPLPPRPRRRRRLLAAAVAVALIASALAAALLSRPAPASALEVIQRARQQFLRLPPFQATIVEKNPHSQIVYRRFYRDPNAWRSEYANVVPPGGVAHTGDYYVWNGRFEGYYQANTNRFTFFPAAMIRRSREDRMATEDLDPHFYFWPGAAVNQRLPADQYFKRRCKVLPNEIVAGREARHLACRYGPYGKLDALKTTTLSIWLDAQYGFILKTAFPANGALFEVRKITLNPSFPPGVFQVKAPQGSKPVWGGPGVPPPALRQKLSPRVAATIPVGPHPAPLAAGAGSLWVANLAAGSITQIDPNANRVILTTHGLHADRLTYAAGSAWVVTTDGFLERIDPVNNRQLGRPIAIGGGNNGRDVAYGDGTLWTNGGKVRTVHFANGWVDGAYESLVRVNPATGRVVADLPLQADLGDGASIAIGEGSAWVATYRSRPSGKKLKTSAVLIRVDPNQNRVVDTLDLGRHSVDKVITGFGSVWVTVGLEGDDPGYLLRIDPHSNQVSAKIRLGGSPAGIAVSPSAIWVANFQDGTLSKVDPATNRVVGTPLPAGDGPDGALYAYGALWVTDNQDNKVVRINRSNLP